VWYCLRVVVTGDEVRRHEEADREGHPAVTEVSFERNNPVYSGTVHVDGQQVLALRLDTAAHTLTDNEVQWFQNLARIGERRIRKGEVIDLHSDDPPGAVSLLDRSKRDPKRTTLKVSKAQLSLAQGTSPAFSIAPRETVLAYYCRNKFEIITGTPSVFRLVRPTREPIDGSKP